MRKISLAGFKDPLRRPRYIMWTGTVVLLLAAFVVTALGATSTYWFCADVCHNVQADTIIAYDRSTHSRVSCVACHMPVNADPATFLWKKAVSLIKIPPTLLGQYSQPLNEGSRVALSQKEMGSQYCTQCHALQNREVTPSPGIIIDHAIHEEAEIHCTVCHNRVAHVQDFELTLTDPQTGEPNRKHEDFMLMTACFRCHTLTGESVSGIVATGACEACHTPDFELMPDNHNEEGFYTLYGESGGHAEMANADTAAYTLARADLEEPKTGDPMYRQIQNLPPAAAVGYCQTCHVEQEFCGGCHGLEMPHPADFNEQHVALGDANPDMCARCHNTTGDPKLNATACDQCHHPAGDPRRPWLADHAEAAHASPDIIADCYSCHVEIFCSVCHVRGEKGSRF